MQDTQLEILLQSAHIPCDHALMARRFPSSSTRKLFRWEPGLLGLKTIPLARLGRVILGKQFQHRPAWYLDDRDEKASKALKEPVHEIDGDKSPVPAGVDGDVLAVFVDLKQEAVVVRERHGQVLSVSQDRGSGFLVVADDSLRGQVGAGQVPVEDGLLAQILETAFLAQDLHGAMFEADH